MNRGEGRDGEWRDGDDDDLLEDWYDREDMDDEDSDFDSDWWDDDDDYDEDFDEYMYIVRMPPIIRAIVEEEEDRVQHLLEQGVDPDTADENGTTALMMSVMVQSHVDMCKILLDGGADVNVVRGVGGHTVLQEAIQQAGQSRNEDVVLLLLSHKEIDVNACDVTGRTALHYAAYSGLVATCKRLLEQGANVNARDSRGSTPLFVSLNYPEDAAIHLLLNQKGIDLHACDEDGDTVFDILLKAPPTKCPCCLERQARLRELLMRSLHEQCCALASQVVRSARTTQARAEEEEEASRREAKRRRLTDTAHRDDGKEENGQPPAAGVSESDLRVQIGQIGRPNGGKWWLSPPSCVIA